MTRLHTLCVLVTWAACLMETGCVSSPGDGLAKKDRSLRDRLPFLGKDKDEKPEPYPNPVKVAATWTPDTLIQSGRTPTRGFGGRLFFYDESSRPVPVEGTLVVHGFDDSAIDEEADVKRFEFTPEQFTRHFSQSDLGASYSVWIPWDAVGGLQRKISLVPSFKTMEGKLVQGLASTVLLPGSSTETAEEKLTAKYAPQFREYQQAMASGKTTGRMTTTTIARRNNPRAGVSTEISNPEKRPTMIAEIDSTPTSKKPIWNGKVTPASVRAPRR